MSSIGGYDPSISGLQTKQTSPAGHVEQPKLGAVDQQTNLASMRSLQLMNSDAVEVKENTDVIFHSGKSPADAACRHLSQITKQFVAAHDVFHLDSVKTEEPNPAAASSSSPASPKESLSGAELSKTLSVVAAKVEAGEVSSQNGAVILQFGKHQLGLFNDWGNRVQGAVKDIENQLSSAGPREKPVLESRLKEAKDLLSDIGTKSTTLAKEVGHLESSLISKYGKEAPDASMPSVHYNPSMAYRLTRLR